MSVFHECGHAILPWHGELDYLCTEKQHDPIVQNRIEREAFGCASEFLMPREMFVDDALSLEIAISAIEQLGYRYVASLEATAIRYAYTHPGLCGIIMLEPTENHSPRAIFQDPKRLKQLPLPLELPLRQATLDYYKRYPLTVKWAVKSRRFPKYIRPGIGVGEDNVVFKAWASRRHVQDEVPAWVFGSSARWAYNAECLPLGNSRMILVLLWLPDRQLKIDFKNRVVL